MTTTHTQSRLRVGANGGFHQGPVNALYTADSEICGDLIAVLQTEPPNPNVEADARRLAACWNVCEGFDTDLLEHILLLGETMHSRFKARDRVEEVLIADRLRFLKERDEARHVIHQIMEIVDKRQVADFVEKFGELPARPRPPAPRNFTTNTCTGIEPKCKWVPDGVGSKCTTCGDTIPF